MDLAKVYHTGRHGRYYPDCPACELNRWYLDQILRKDITEEERDSVDEVYRIKTGRSPDPSDVENRFFLGEMPGTN
ncbi:hypothetical protein LCGC14_2269080 [marine sediment metagenome]|uniref:Uncharacterized protein n=1 Tax=marine sediment metagenome TaxID=412755 RepID=A0A0F9CXR2_9ZZZZ